METRQLGKLWPVSALTLGGGIGGIWGPSTYGERIATVHEAIAGGVTLLDMAPMYGNGEAERVVGEAFGGRLPEGVRVTTKHLVGAVPAAEVYDRLRSSLEASLERMHLDRVDLFFLHGTLLPDGVPVGGHPAFAPDGFGTSWSVYADAVRPALERLCDEGLVGAWGITGHGDQKTLHDAIDDDHAPAAVQCIANLLDSPGWLFGYEGQTRPRELIAAANARGIGVIGIRIVQAGALTDGFDREVANDTAEQRDFERAAPVRAIARELGVTASYLAYRYALSMEGVATIVLGVKNREELRECLVAEADGRLDPGLISRIDRAVA